MSKISVIQQAEVTRRVEVEFDADNRPEYEIKGKRYQVASVTIAYKWGDGLWVSPWMIRGQRAQKLKDGSWGALVATDLYGDRKMIEELCAEYRPTTRIEIKEQN